MEFEHFYFVLILKPSIEGSEAGSLSKACSLAVYSVIRLLRTGSHSSLVVGLAIKVL